MLAIHLLNADKFRLKFMFDILCQRDNFIAKIFYHFYTCWEHNTYIWLALKKFELYVTQPPFLIHK